MRTHLLDVAERLFAERGLDAVSLNSIAREANQRNASVMQYYFGSKMALIEAVLGRRMEQVNADRAELIARITLVNRRAALRQLAEAMVLPLARHLLVEGGSRYLRFVAQVAFNADKTIFQIVRGKHDEPFHMIATLAERILSPMDPDLVRHRLAVVTSLVLFTVGEREKLRLAGRRSGVARLSTRQFIGEMIEIIAAILSAPGAKSDRRARAALARGLTGRAPSNPEATPRSALPR